MELFLVSLSNEVKNPIVFVEQEAEAVYPARMSHEDFSKINHAALHFDVAQHYEIPDVLAHPTYMVSDKVKNVLEMYDSTIEFKLVQTLPMYSKQVDANMPAYWVYDCEHVDCVHEETRILPNGEMENITLKYNMVVGKDIFRIKSMLSNKLVISLPVAESILRRNVYGIELLPLKLK